MNTETGRVGLEKERWHEEKYDIREGRGKDKGTRRRILGRADKQINHITKVSFTLNTTQLSFSYQQTKRVLLGLLEDSENDTLLPKVYEHLQQILAEEGMLKNNIHF